jgi:hypothetical protein
MRSPEIQRGHLFHPEDGGSNSSETLVNIYHTTFHCITEENNLRTRLYCLHLTANYKLQFIALGPEELP